MTKTIPLPPISASAATITYVEKKDAVTPTRTLGKILLNGAKDFEVQLGNRVFPVLHGDAIYLPPFCECRVTRADDNAFGVFSLAISPALTSVFSPSLSRRHTVGRARYLFDCSTQEELFALCNVLINGEMDKSFSTIVRILSILESESLSETEEKYEISLPLLLRKALSYLDEHRDEAVNAEILAARYGISPDTVKRLFRRHLSSTVREQHLRKRTIGAAFLYENKEDLEDILQSCGFSSKSTFKKSYFQIFSEPLK